MSLSRQKLIRAGRTDMQGQRGRFATKAMLKSVEAETLLLLLAVSETRTRRCKLMQSRRHAVVSRQREGDPFSPLSPFVDDWPQHVKRLKHET
jgi:hypothetical protein